MRALSLSLTSAIRKVRALIWSCESREGAELLAIFPAFFGEAGGYLLDAFEALVDGHRSLHCSRRAARAPAAAPPMLS